ncbi:MAG TPA: ATPase, partial [Caldilineaceae bacterium]|nr:ATPase [Caldilineaceae bacterium]
MRQELDTYIRARYPLLWIVTPEEKRALEELEALAKHQRKPLLLWSATAGVVNAAVPQRADGSKRDPLALLAAIIEDREPGIWVLRDFHPFLRDHTVVRRLREAAFGLEASNKTIILLGPVLKIPPELEKEITVVDFALPSAAQLSAMLEEIIAAAGQRGNIEVSLDRRQRGRLVQACLGLTA